MVRHTLTFDIITSPTYYTTLFSIWPHVAFGVMTFGVLERDRASLRDGELARALECRTWKRLLGFICESLLQSIWSKNISEDGVRCALTNTIEDTRRAGVVGLMDVVLWMDISA